MPEKESDQYFSTRPRESQIAALASEQSRLLKNRELLEKGVRETEMLYEDREISRPPYWGGYFLSPLSIEFLNPESHQKKFAGSISLSLLCISKYFHYEKQPFISRGS